MTERCFIAHMRTPEGPKVHHMICETQAEAVDRAVDFCKTQFGPGSKVTSISFISTRNALKLIADQVPQLLAGWEQYKLAVAGSQELIELCQRNIERIEETQTMLAGLIEEMEGQTNGEVPD